MPSPSLDYPVVNENNVALKQFLRSWFDNGALTPSATTTQFLAIVNASPTMRELLGRAALDKVDIWAFEQATDAAYYLSANGTSRAKIRFSTSMVDAAKRDLQGLTDFVYSLAHELGHAYGNNGSGVDAPAPTGTIPTMSADTYAWNEIYWSEGAGATYMVQVALEIKLNAPNLVANNVELRGLPPGSYGVLAAKYDTHAKLAPTSFEVDIRTRTQKYLYEERSATVGGGGTQNYWDKFVKKYIAAQMGFAKCNFPGRNIQIYSKAPDYMRGTDWWADVKLSPNSPITYRYNAQDPSRLQVFNLGREQGYKQLFSTKSCQLTDIPQLPSSTVAYQYMNSDGNLVLGDRLTNAAETGEFGDAGEELDAGTAWAIESPDDWLEYNVYDGDNGISIKLAEGGKLVFDEASSSKAFYVKRPSEAQPNVELGAVGGAAVGVGSDDYTSIIVSRPGIGELPLGTLLANDDTQASFFAAANGGELRGLVDVTNTIHGYGGNDTLFGGAKADVLYGSLGNDTLDGGAGADHMEGGLDDDTYFVDDVGDQVDELANQGYDTVKVHQGALSSGSYLLQANIEAGELLADAGNAKLYGNELDNQLKGNAGNNWLDGGAGADRMEGGAGDDYYVVGNTGDQVIELGSEGYDTVQAYVDSYVMSENVEKLQLFGTGAPRTTVTGRGNNQANNMVAMGLQYAYLYGEGGNDSLYAGAGAGALLNGGAGNDKLFGSSGRDYIDGRDGGEFDELYGGDNIDTILADGDFVKGGAGDDTITCSYSAGSTIEWGLGDGRDTVRASNLDTVKFTGSGYSLTATLSGTDLILTTDGRNGMVLKNWVYELKPTVELPDGRRITAAQMDQFIHPAVTGWQYSGGTFGGSAQNLYNVAVSYSGLFADAEAFWTPLLGQSMFVEQWQNALVNGNYTGRFQGTSEIHSSSVSASFSYPGYNGNDPYAFGWAIMNYDFWLNGSGGYEVAITSISAGYGGQVSFEVDPSTGENVGHQIPRYVQVSAGYGYSQVVLDPAVTSAVLYSPTAGAMASQMGEAAALYLNSPEALNLVAAPARSFEYYDAAVSTQDLALTGGPDGPQLDFYYGNASLHFGRPSSSPDVVSAANEATNADSFGRETRVSVMPVPVNDFRLVA
ncbi:hypothetical protein ACG04Q_19260 [Roseateles sp. DXS20W]|uniref:Haemolysin-type calcium binding-related domain-containing protein n=1 Tax=Pelomonas lactea TaxID=3299030 RepID=A0ABW7GPF7_9BURK